MPTKPLNVVVIGGSLAGLMQGIVFKRLGHNVHILEQHPTSARESQAAGIDVGVDGQEFLRQHDLIKDRPHFVETSKLLDLDRNFEEMEEPAWARLMKKAYLTDWKTLYYRLRANYDGLASDYVSMPPASQESDGTAVYEVGKRVKDVAYDEESRFNLVFEDLETGNTSSLHPDMVIAADGANSNIRKVMFPGIESEYSGYVTWRGVIPEKEVSAETMKLLENKCVRYFVNEGYFVTYIIPGEHGGIAPGHRHVNFVWYNIIPQSSHVYKASMTDIHGQLHRNTVPFGLVSPAVWKAKVAETSSFADPFKEIVSKIDTPFVTAISDCISPSPSMFGGKLFLVGDALAAFRPHVGQSTNQAGLHALLMQKLMKGGIGLEEYEKTALGYAEKTIDWSREEGKRCLKL